ncbi:bifunctional metallophosphatase/5'-nucleotidase [Hymenobacter aerophilus]|uniref:bifunctional metallophosphatase/5'-nucleotidase n=1 Tax=Hymenobacter aerophilus TaxID=119644 RepID=UPI00039B3FDC|nr:5'-nucleotidase C-terminal domain-containing protein [Hymenobacter aerophilus]
MNSPTSTTTLTLLQLNDVHGYLNLHQEVFPGPEGFTYRPCGGYARLAAVLHAWRRQHANCLLFDGGDTFHGTRPVVETQGEILLPVLRELGIAGMTAHWDFAYGPAHLKALVSQLNYPLLAANVYDKATGEPFFPPYQLYETGGLRVGVVGLACPIVEANMPAHFSEGLHFTDGHQELPRYIAELREQKQADVVVLLSHCGFPQDMALLSRHAGVDVCLSSHTHNRLYEPVQVNGCLLMQSGAHGSFAGRLTLQLENGRVVGHEHELREISADITPDPVVQALVDHALAPFAHLREAVGITRGALHRATAVNAPMDDFLLESLRFRVPGAAVYLANGWRYGAPVPPGPVRLDDLYDINPMDSEIETVELTGVELWQLLEQNLEKTYSPDPLCQMGGYVKRALGLKVYFKVENPAGTRVQRVFVGDELLDPARTYQAVFITVQAVPEGLGRNRRGTGHHAVAAMRAYLDRHRPLAVAQPETFVVT